MSSSIESRKSASENPSRHHGSGLKRPRGVLFDHDGVLVASEPLHWAAWEQLFQELKLPYHESELRARVGKPAPLILGELLDIHRPGWDRSEYDLNALALRKNDFFLAEAQRSLKLYPGVRELLEWLKVQGIPAAVVSNAKRRELGSALEGLGVAPLFKEIISRDDVPAPKPDPAPYLIGAACLGVEPGECLAVEDSPPGLEAALLAKIPTAAIGTNFPHEILAQPVPGRPELSPVWIGNSIQDLFDALKHLADR